jgi:hypothetical protein
MTPGVSILVRSEHMHSDLGLLHLRLAFEVFHNI